jgi:Lipid A 3-O-deacylase (PagL)
MNLRKIFCCLLILCSLSVSVFSQTDSLKSCHSFFIQPELLVGKIAPNYEPYPPSSLKETLVIDIGESSIDNKIWGKFYNHPDFGMSFTFSQLGNQNIFGNEIDVIPYIAINTSHRLKNTWYLKIGLGASYFTKRFDSVSNPLNSAISSNFTWAFKLFAYRTILVNKTMNLSICGGYCHSSDGHTELPNLGLNSALVGLSAQFNTHPANPDFVYPSIPAEQLPKTYFIQLRTGEGFHACGSPFKPPGGPKYGVFSTAVSGGFIVKQHIKLRAGFTYRNYGRLMDYTGESYSAWQSSNIFFSLGCEFLVGHFGLDVEGGLNLYKPFYRRFYGDYEGSTTSTFYYLKSLFPLRLGINYYLITPYKFTRCNVFIGATIDANFGQADFSELNLGYSIRI